MRKLGWILLALLAATPALASGPTTMNYEYYRRCSDETKSPDQRIVECGRAMTFEKAFGIKAQYGLYVDRGLAYYEKGELENALADFNQAIALGGVPVEAYDNRGEVYLAMGRYQSALEDFNQAIAMKPSHALAFSGRAEAYAAMGDYDHAMQDYESAITLDPDKGDIYKSRCLTRVVHRSDFNGALADCDKAVRLSPKDADAFDTRALVLFKMGNYPDVIADTSSALDLNMRDAAALYLRGLAKLKMGDTAGGNVNISDAKTFDPNVADTLAGYGVKP